MKDQILSSYLSTFRDQFQLADLDESEAFEHFVNHCLISKHHPDPFDPSDVTIGASGDMGLDGVVWNTRFVELGRDLSTWSPDDAVVTGIARRYDEKAGTILAWRIEHLSDWLKLSIADGP